MRDLFSTLERSRYLHDGRIYSAVVGVAGTPTSFAKTAFDADQPQLVVDVPAATTIVPLTAELTLQDSAGTDTTMALLAATVNVGAGTSTAVTPVNAHFGHSRTSDCSVYSLYTANGTDPATGTEQWLDHTVYAFADATTDPVKKFEVALEPVEIDGTGSFVVYIFATTTAPAGFLKVRWLELPTAKLA